ncbi:zinc-ribbon domain-containing protein [Palleronia sp.]|uniref:zinc-ribbon domain-containing protein n=1 Tax=Palleronia sp. TaxID=1940284 RepID=UPI0035C8237C
MRIICPNCAAQYEVDATLIPQEGRDVQCSACGHTWMQYADGTVEEIADASDPVPETATPEPAPPAAPPETEPEPLPVEAEPASAEVDEADTPGPRGQRRELDEDARQILREEAQREAARRRARRVTGIETQPDLGLEDQPPKSRPPEPETKPEPEPEVQPAPAEDAVRTVHPRRPDRSAFPDIEELNSTLTASDSGETEADDTTRSGGGAFRTGFLLMLSLAILIMALYLAAPQIAASVPALQAELAAYVGAVNELRAAVEGLFQNAAQWIESLSA